MKGQAVIASKDTDYLLVVWPNGAHAIVYNPASIFGQQPISELDLLHTATDALRAAYAPEKA